MNERYDWLQALRGTAALMVLFFHLKPHWDTIPQLAVFGPAMQWGFSGVDVFFVLSGFVVHQSTRQLSWGPSLRKYALRRAARIYLTYWPALAAVALINLTLLDKPLPSIDVLWRSVLLLEPSIFKNWLPVAWSLTYELYFYVLLGVVMLFQPQRQGRILVLLIGALVLWSGTWLMSAREQVYAGSTPLRFITSAYIIEFMAGALLSHWMLMARQTGRALIAPQAWADWALCGVACAVLGLAVGTTSPYFDRVEIMRTATFGLVGLGGLLIALALHASPLQPPTWLVRVGDCSFGLYLLHAPLLDVFGLLRYRASLVSSELALGVALVAPLAIVAIGLLWFRLLEAPSIRLTRRLH
jgi:exopolysaccharide production protein ExoZ